MCVPVVALSVNPFVKRNIAAIDRSSSNGSTSSSRGLDSTSEISQTQ